MIETSPIGRPKTRRMVGATFGVEDKQLRKGIVFYYNMSKKCMVANLKSNMIYYVC